MESSTENQQWEQILTTNFTLVPITKSIPEELDTVFLLVSIQIHKHSYIHIHMHKHTCHISVQFFSYRISFTFRGA